MELISQGVSELIIENLWIAILTIQYGHKIAHVTTAHQSWPIVTWSEHLFII